MIGGDIFTQKWFASNYLDDDRCGVVAYVGAIVVGVSVGLTREQCESVANYHNTHTLLTAGVNC